MAAYKHLDDWLKKIDYKFELKHSNKADVNITDNIHKTTLSIPGLSGDLHFEADRVRLVDSRKHENALFFKEIDNTRDYTREYNELFLSILDHCDGVIKDIFKLGFSGSIAYKTCENQVDRLKNRIKSILDVPLCQHLDQNCIYNFKQMKSGHVVDYHSAINWFTEKGLYALRHGYTVHSYHTWPEVNNIHCNDQKGKDKLVDLLFMLFLSHLAKKPYSPRPSIVVQFVQPENKSIISSFGHRSFVHAALVVGPDSDWISGVDVIIQLASRPQNHFDILNVFVVESVFKLFSQRLKERMDKIQDQKLFSLIDYNAISLDKVLDDDSNEDSLHLFKFRTIPEVIGLLNHFAERLQFSVLWLNRVSLAMEMKSKITGCCEFWIDSLPFFSALAQIDRPEFVNESDEDQKLIEAKMAAIPFEERVKLVGKHVEKLDFIDSFPNAVYKARNLLMRTKTIDGHLLISTFKKTPYKRIFLDGFSFGDENLKEFFLTQLLLANALEYEYLCSDHDQFVEFFRKANLDSLFKNAIKMKFYQIGKKREDGTVVTGGGADLTPITLPKMKQILNVCEHVWIPIENQLNFHQ